MVSRLASAETGKRIFLVEDELMIRMLLEDMLDELGYTVTAQASHIDEALEAAKTADFDLAPCRCRPYIAFWYTLASLAELTTA